MLGWIRVTKVRIILHIFNNCIIYNYICTQKLYNSRYIDETLFWEATQTGKLTNLWQSVLMSPTGSKEQYEKTESLYSLHNMWRRNSPSENCHLQK